MSIRLSIIAVIAGSMFMAGTSYGHHGWRSYKTPLEGQYTIVELRLGNPHDRLIAVDADGQEWNLLLAPPARNRRFGFNEESVSVGDVVEIIGQQHPTKQEIKVHCINVDGENLYTYRYDSGTSSLRRSRSDRDSCT